MVIGLTKQEQDHVRDICQATCRGVPHSFLTIDQLMHLCDRALHNYMSSLFSSYIDCHRTGAAYKDHLIAVKKQAWQIAYRECNYVCRRSCPTCS
jgi:hypothetical protein